MYCGGERVKCGHTSSPLHNACQGLLLTSGSSQELELINALEGNMYNTIVFLFIIQNKILFECIIRPICMVEQFHVRPACHHLLESFKFTYSMICAYNFTSKILWLMINYADCYKLIVFLHSILLCKHCGRAVLHKKPDSTFYRLKNTTLRI